MEVRAAVRVQMGKSKKQATAAPTQIANNRRRKASLIGLRGKGIPNRRKMDSHFEKVPREIH